MSDDKGILLQSGTNELEVIEFGINGIDKCKNYCINVAKVREVIHIPDFIPLPESDGNIIGAANYREHVIPLINLSGWLGHGGKYDPSRSKVVVTYFNSLYTGYVVDEVRRIHRIRWSDIRDFYTMTDVLNDIVIGVVELNGELVQLLDLERIVSEMNPERVFSVKTIHPERISLRAGKKIFIADDSSFIRHNMESMLDSAGYITEASDNGDELLKLVRNEKPHAIVTDLEMPGVSGDFVVKTVRENSYYDDVIVIVFSSMWSKENEIKLKSIGANYFFGKPDAAMVLEVLDNELLDKSELEEFGA